MTSHNETFSRQNLWAPVSGQHCKIYDVRLKQCAVTCECWPTTTVTARLFQLQNFQLCNISFIMTGPSGNSEFCFRRISVFFSAAPWETLRNTDICFPRNQSLASLSDDDGYGNENGNKAVGLDKQNNNFARVSHILYISLPSLHDYDVKLPNCTF